LFASIDFVEIIGLVAATLTTYAFFPQVYKTWQSKDVSGFSLPTFSLFCLGIVFWLIYGLYKQSISMILANALTLCSSIAILYFIVKYRNK
jgi:MtN3 and saliva related transmembrane protein